MSATRADEAACDYLDTVALLQEEIARLEAELLRRDEDRIVPDEAPRDHDEGGAARIADLTALLADRDETIGLLWEQLAALEEAGAARAAEWDQLSRWVEELEERVDRDGSRPREPDEAPGQVEALRERLEAQDRARQAERDGFEREIGRLRSRLAEASGTTDEQARAALEAENRRLHAECRRLAALEPEAAEAIALRARASELLDQLAQARQALDRANDELRRERVEREAEAAIRRASTASANAAGAAEASPDERFQALRLHLRELHEQEERARAERQLFHRLSRLWRRSGEPG